MPTWDVYQLSDLKQQLGLDEQAVMELVLTNQLSPEDCVRPTGQAKWYRVGQARSYFEKLASKLNWRPPSIPRTDSPDKVGAISMPPPAPGAKPARSRQDPFPHVRAEKHKEEEDDGGHFGKRSLDQDEWDLTPMVDMTFLLNMFFMLTTTYALLQSLKVPPPAPRDEATSAKTVVVSDAIGEMIIARINEDGQVTIDDEPVSIDNVVATIRRIQRDASKNKILVIPDPEGTVESLVAVLDAANEVGLQEVKLGRAAVD